MIKHYVVELTNGKVTVLSDEGIMICSVYGLLNIALQSGHEVVDLIGCWI